MEFDKFIDELKTKWWASVVDIMRIERKLFADLWRPMHIYCSEHGAFIESAEELLKGWRCPQCNIDEDCDYTALRQCYLSDEIILQICAWIDLDSLKALRETCRQMRELITPSALECKWLGLPIPTKGNQREWLLQHSQWIIANWKVGFLYHGKVIPFIGLIKPIIVMEDRFTILAFRGYSQEGDLGIGFDIDMYWGEKKEILLDTRTYQNSQKRLIDIILIVRHSQIYHHSADRWGGKQIVIRIAIPAGEYPVKIKHIQKTDNICNIEGEESWGDNIPYIISLNNGGHMSDPESREESEEESEGE